MLTLAPTPLLAATSSLPLLLLPLAAIWELWIVPPMKGNNFKNADKFNELFYKSIPQDAKEDIIAELEQIQCND